MIKLTIDGKAVSVDRGTTILEAAKDNGIGIPSLCKYEGLSPLAHCRLCVVEATQNGRNKVVTSCNYQVDSGMVVETQTDNIVAIRKTIVELLLARSPSVPVINRLADEMGVDVSAKRFLLGNDKCILCGLCVHVCSEYIGASAITFSSQGAGKYVSAPFSGSAGDCIGCGACVEICPAQCISMTDVDEAKTFEYGDQKKIGPARLIRNWNVRIPWKKCEKCGDHFPPPSPMEHLKKGAALPKNFFDICEKCQ